MQTPNFLKHPVPPEERDPPECTRRDFLVRSAACLAGISVLGNLPFSHFSDEAAWAKNSPELDELLKTSPDARYWTSSIGPNTDCRACHGPDEKLSDGAYHDKNPLVACRLCAQNCMIRPGERGVCRTRMNVDGRLRSLVYGRPVSVHADPIEKKPFYHFLPGSSAFSLATVGCPLQCKFCQNWEISQARPEDFSRRFVAPEEIASACAQNGSPVIAFTYNEPTVFTEYLLDIAAASRKTGIKNVIISCGFMNPEPLDDMCDALDAIKIDLKGFDADFYRKVCGAELEPVLQTIRRIAKKKVHLEIVNLVVPTLNDSETMLTELVNWIIGETGPDTPVHFTRFHPDYQLRNLPPTPTATLEKAYEIARTHGLRYPYVGNVPGHSGYHTRCPRCGQIAVERSGFFVTALRVKNGACDRCGEKIHGVWSG